MNVFGYLRVSSKGQIDGDGFDRQRDTILAFCNAKGWRITRFFEEAGVSGTVEGANRPAFAEMIALAGPATATTIVVERADRVARDLVVSEVLLKAAREAGISIYDAAAELELTTDGDPARVLIRQIFGALAQFEKSSLVKKLRAARNRKRDTTGRCEGPKPFESHSVGKEIVGEIVRLRSGGHTLGGIARSLTKARYLSPSGVTKWHKSTIANILARAEGRFPSAPPDPRLFPPLV